MKNRKTLRRWIVLALVGAIASPGVAAAKNDPVKKAALGYVELGNAHLLYPDLVRAFIPTGSSSTLCLVTLSESNFAVRGTVVFCAPRVQDEVDGVLVTILLGEGFPPEWWDWDQDPNPELILSLTVHQQGARRYGPPAPWMGD